MNFYPRYSGHYVARTLHLSMEQDGAYNRLLDWYYLQERAIPNASRYAIARATSAGERKAVDTVLAEFFERDGDVWRNRRADAEIAEAQPRIAAAKKNGRAGGRPKKDRSANPPATQQKPNGFPNGLPAGNPAGEAAGEPPHSPFPIPPSDTSASAGSFEGHGERPPGERAMTAAGLAALLMRQAGCANANPGHVDLLAALSEGVTPETLGETAREALAMGKRKPFAWAIETARGRHADGPKPTPTGAPHAAAHPANGGARREGVADRSARVCGEFDARLDEAERRVQ